MATVYVLYSPSIDRFYIGSCKDLSQRLLQHNGHIHSNAFTLRASDWTIYFTQENLEYDTARKIEKHIKTMKSRKYIHNIKKYPEIIHNLIEKFAGSSR